MRFLLCFLMLAPVVAAMPARAQSVLSDILARGTLRVGLTGDYRPFSIKDSAGQFSGMDVDEAEALARGMGVKLEVVPTAWPMLMGDLMAHKFDVAMGGITITLERAKTAYFSTAVMRSGKTAIARCADKDKFDTLAQIDQPGVRVIANPGGTNEKFDRANLTKASLVMFTDNAGIFDELVAGHADVMITDGVETRLQQRLHPELCAIHPEQPFNTSELAYMMPQDMPLQQFVDQFLTIEQQSGARAALVTKWLP